MKMFYDLMHKDTEVIQLSLDDNGLIESHGKVISPEHLPIGTFQKGILNDRDLKEWWSKRSIPASRIGIKDILYKLDVPCTTALITRCMGLSLSDQYWIRESGTDVSWGDVNFFDNGFSEDLGNLMFGTDLNKKDLNLNTPDNTSDGILKKRWKIIDGARYLIKSGGGIALQEPFNELVASHLMDILDIDHVHYDLTWMDGRPYSICADFIDRDTELISASNFLNSYSRKKDNKYTQYVSSCSQFGIDIVPTLDRMIVTDFIMINTDRHLNNFGMVRDADTLEMIGPAPIYDNGTSLGNDLLTRELPQKLSGECKPFKNTFEEQIKLVTDFGWIDFDRLFGSEERIREILSIGDFLDKDRIEILVDTVMRRISKLEAIAADN